MTFSLRHQLPIFGLITLLAGPACTGMTLGENTPGGTRGTYLEDGSIAVDPRTERVYVMRRNTITREDASGRMYEETFSKELFVVDPDSGTPRLLADVSDLSDLRMLFPPGQVLLMGERRGFDVLRPLDPISGATIREVETNARYHGIRMAPSGRYIAVADNSDPDVPLHLIDSRSFQILPIAHDGAWLEVAWANQDDTLIAMVDYQERGALGTLSTPEPAEARMRFIAWDARQLAADGFPMDGAFFANPIFDVEVEGVARDGAFSFSWVGVSPDDGYAVFPVRAYRPEDPASTGPGGDAGWRADLLVVDLADGTTRRVRNGFGPVGFTPDGSTVVSYRYSERTTPDGAVVHEPSLLLVDTMTLAEEELAIPFDGGPSFFVTREGNYVVVASAGLRLDEDLVLYDLDSGDTTRVARSRIGLREFVSRPGRPELWLVDTGWLYRLDLMSATLSRMTLPGQVDRINILPSRDRLVLGDRRGTGLAFFDPEAQIITRQVELPPVDTRL